MTSHIAYDIWPTITDATELYKSFKLTRHHKFHNIWFLTASNIFRASCFGWKRSNKNDIEMNFAFHFEFNSTFFGYFVPTVIICTCNDCQLELYINETSSRWLIAIHLLFWPGKWWWRSRICRNWNTNQFEITNNKSMNVWIRTIVYFFESCNCFNCT